MAGRAFEVKTDGNKSYFEKKKVGPNRLAWEENTEKSDFFGGGCINMRGEIWTNRPTK